ncbi:MAG TPA: M13 family metallopeptidase, partial [Thermoplasmata archaeon]|nr:M13 family metallopeptidase [Thermoplasmata archaeon]
RSLAEWRTYLRWHLLTDSAPYLHDAAEAENFAFFHRTLLGQQEPEPRWKRAARVIDMTLGEALGKLYVDAHFPPEARRRMRALVDDLRAVFRGRLERLAWMTPATRQKALSKFDRFTAKIGHPEVFRDYSAVRVDPSDYLGNVRRAATFEVRRQTGRIGKPVDRREWHMTPPEVNAYFDPTQNEIVFPAGILQPPFFDLTMDDAVNYGAIGAVIGHEITHGYDDQGRKFDAEGNLADWWSSEDAQEFDRRAQRIVEEYNAFEALPGVHVNGELTMGENIADVGGVSIAYEALQRRLAADPAQRRNVDGFTPEQRFFLSFAQVWRQNVKEADLRRRLTVDPHSPARFRAVGALTNLPEFYAAFGVRAGAPMWRPEDRRVAIW